jgi:HD-like signal output (HDOD) protein
MVLPKLQRLLTNPNSGIFEIVELVRLDAGLASRIIHISNSAWFGRGASCETIEQAVNRVGFHNVQRLVATAAVSTVVARSLSAYSLDDKAMWKESVSCAMAAELLATRVGEDAAEAYTIGLLHAVGRVAINDFVRGAMPSWQLSDEGFPGEHSVAESSRLGFTQADVGASMLKNWEFGSPDIEPIRAQYAPLAVNKPFDRMAAVLHGARMLRTIVCYPEIDRPVRPDTHVLDMLRMTESELLGFIPDLRAQLTLAKQMTELK